MPMRKNSSELGRHAIIIVKKKRMKDMAMKEGMMKKRIQKMMKVIKTNKMMQENTEEMMGEKMKAEDEVKGTPACASHLKDRDHVVSGSI